MAKNDRLEKVYSKGTMNITEIWVDKATGVNYFCFCPNEYYYHLLSKEEQTIFDAKHDWARVISFD